MKETQNGCWKFFSIIKHQQKFSGIIRDYNKLETMSTDINAFNQSFHTEGGHGSLTIAKDGLETYKQDRVKKMMAVGSAIGLNQPLTSLANNGYKFWVNASFPQIWRISKIHDM